MKNAFCFIWKVVFVLKIFKFCPNIFGHVVKWLDKKNKLISKFMTSSTRKLNNYSAHIAHCLKKQSQSDIEIWSVNRM